MRALTYVGSARPPIFTDLAGFFSTTTLQNASYFCRRFCSLPPHLKASDFLKLLNTTHSTGWPAIFSWAKARPGNSSCFDDDNFWWLLFRVPPAPLLMYWWLSILNSTASNLMCFCNPTFHFKIKGKKNHNKTVKPSFLSSISVQPSLSLKRSLLHFC